MNVNLTDSPATCMGGDHIGLNCITCCMPSLSSRVDYQQRPCLFWYEVATNKAFSSTKPDAARCWIAFHVNNHPLLYIFQRFTHSWDITRQMMLFQLCHSVLKWRPIIYFQIKSVVNRTWTFQNKIRVLTKWKPDIRSKSVCMSSKSKGNHRKRHTAKDGIYLFYGFPERSL